MNQFLALTRYRTASQTFVLCACIVALCLSASASQPTIVTVDPPGSAATFVLQINSSGTIVGAYLDANNLFHGFRRTSDGTFTSYDAPGAGTGPFEGTAVYSINASGQMAGQFQDTRPVFRAFLLTAQGKYTVFDVPNAGTGQGQGTFLWNINNPGDAAGGYVDTANVSHGYVRAADGTVTEYDVPGAGTGSGQGTEAPGCIIDCINPAGTLAGGYIDATNAAHGFIRSKHGDITEFDAPGESNGTYLSGIDPRGEVVGTYVDANNVAFHRY